MADPDKDGNQMTFQEQSVRIHVDEPFKGVSKGQVIELYEGANDCAAKFRTGQRAVFYLQGDPTRGVWRVPPCTHSLGNVESGGDDLLFLQGLPRSAKGTRLSGEVKLYEDSPKESFRRVGGVRSVKVKVAGPKGFIQETVTNAAGGYEVYGLLPGTYSVSIEVPAGLKLKFPVTAGSPQVKGDDAAVKLLLNGSASVSFVLQSDTRLSGHTLDSKGNPVKGLCLDLRSVEGQGENSSHFTCSNENGLFEMEMMSPGKYWLVAQDNVKEGSFISKSTLYYPGVRDREKATTISLEAGKYMEHLEIQIPSDEKRNKVTGRVQFADGIPAANATVTFISPQHGYSETTNTNPDGSFSMLVVAGIEGQLNGQLGVLEPILNQCPELKVGPRRRGMFRFIDANPISFSVDSDRQDLQLELLSPSCKIWPATRKVN